MAKVGFFQRHGLLINIWCYTKSFPDCNHTKMWKDVFENHLKGLYVFRKNSVVHGNDNVRSNKQIALKDIDNYDDYFADAFEDIKKFILCQKSKESLEKISGFCVEAPEVIPSYSKRLKFERELRTNAYTLENLLNKYVVTGELELEVLKYLLILKIGLKIKLTFSFFTKFYNLEKREVKGSVEYFKDFGATKVLGLNLDKSSWKKHERMVKFEELMA